jgi:hypothetical protein
MMKSGLLSALSVVSLGVAACSPTSSTTQAAASEAPSEATPTPVATDPTPVPVPDRPASGPTQRTVPEAFRGVWDANLEACGDTSDMKLTITETTVTFWESGGMVVATNPVGEHSTRLEADGHAEGEPWHPVIYLDLSSDGQTLTIPNEYGTAVRIRCPATPDR